MSDGPGRSSKDRGEEETRAICFHGLELKGRNRDGEIREKKDRLKESKWILCFLTGGGEKSSRFIDEEIVIEGST